MENNSIHIDPCRLRAITQRKHKAELFTDSCGFCIVILRSHSGAGVDEDVETHQAWLYAVVLHPLDELVRVLLLPCGEVVGIRLKKVPKIETLTLLHAEHIRTINEGYGARSYGCCYRISSIALSRGASSNNNRARFSFSKRRHGVSFKTRAFSADARLFRDVLLECEALYCWHESTPKPRHPETCFHYNRCIP